jgi:preprotein translocase subunit SecD
VKDKNGNINARYRLGPAFLTGSAVETAAAKFDQNTNEYVVTLTLKGGENGIDTFNKVAQQCFNGEATCPAVLNRTGSIAITLDGVVQSAPAIQPDGQSFSPFQRDQISISGSFTEGSANQLALVLKYGALPVQLIPQAVQTVSATLGKDSLRAGIAAGLVGLALVVAFMLFYYRGMGLVVLGGLAVSGALLWSVIAYLGANQGLALTLAGATGIIVSIGVTVDSYVVYFERLKDDVRAGKSLKASAVKGFSNAYRTILAADLVSLIGAFILWWLTVGSVRGFAFFLGLSTILDMIVAYFFTRPAVILLSRSRFYAGKKTVMGVTTGEGMADKKVLVGASS